MNRTLISAACCALLAFASPSSYAQQSAEQSANAAGSVAAPVSGIDLKSLDPAVRPQDDFYGYVNGVWTRNTEIPADKSVWGTYIELRETAQGQLKALIDATLKNPGKAGSDTHKIADLYTSFMDEKARNAAGFKPLQADLAHVAAVKDKKDLPALFAYLQRNGIQTPFSAGVSPDAQNPEQYTVGISQSGLGLPDRDYYLKDDDAKLKAVRGKYQQHIATMLGMSGDKNAAEHAAQILDIETRLAAAQWTRVAMRDPVKSYNRIEFSKFAELAPAFDWATYFKAAGLAPKAASAVVRQPDYLASLSATITAVPLEAWKSYFNWRIIESYAPYMDSATVKERFAFEGTVLRGTPQSEPLWQLALRFTDSAVSDAVGKRYVEMYLPPETKPRVMAMFNNFVASFKDGIDKLDWMGEETKKEAQAKLAALKPNIAYPEKWRDYSAMKTQPHDLIANVRASRVWGRQQNLAKLGKPVDREEWSMTPQTVNASYNPLLNAITIPAAILQPPFFNVKAEDAVNYGLLGITFGHEISHAFDDSGSQYDAHGRLRNWWTAQDRTAFKARAAGLVKQYGAYSPVPGYFINGELTLGENIGDNSGLSVTYNAYERSLGGKPSPVIDGLTGEQRLYIGFAMKWRAKLRPEAAIAQIKSDPHSPGEFRAKGTVMNQPGFYKAFDIKPGDAMYLAPEQRVIMW
ncbi:MULTISPECIES: M13 family metallopeptidase [unclassified Janthinobacterium]|uniref:M13 family metallopeptidase n=1 Tax=unclassified Janthinobacterium TaxID=2610881 RepID=UPI00161E1CFD|nr:MULTISPECIES: M13 family metallopeptidase [unclassified Janthinobacterium]MBB5366775.1 putative metalloendopeptidase [Janthinobacterium sp. K2C7]MBB5380747.1 putative metalloendopeptidase [Janthinobacterium sp. K2Li3]MBB5385157.1 putative metalloendopeptidase [Janthinobacterium sp. K2E3]